MELRSYNVERIYKESVKCRIKDAIGITEKFEQNIPVIKDMISQIKTVDGYAHLCACNRRKDDEIWTPYLQIVEMLILMGKKIGCIKYTGRLQPQTLIKILDYGKN